MIKGGNLNMGQRRAVGLRSEKKARLIAQLEHHNVLRKRRRNGPSFTESAV